MTDIVERLRENATNPDCFNDPYPEVLEQAADEIERLRAALRIIAGYEQCIDNLMSNVDVARAALGKNSHD